MFDNHVSEAECLDSIFDDADFEDLDVRAR